MKVNWINSWNAGNKKEKYEINLRIGTVTILRFHSAHVLVAKQKDTVINLDL